MTQDGWETKLSRLAGEQIQYMRKRAGLSAEELAKRCTEIGFPMKRHVIASLENKRRSSVSMAEIIAIATVLQIPPLYLIYPIQDPARRVPGPPPLGTERAWMYHDWFRGYPWASSATYNAPDGEPSKFMTSALDAWASIYRLERALKRFDLLSESLPGVEEITEVWPTHPPGEKSVDYEITADALWKVVGLLNEIGNDYEDLRAVRVKMVPLIEDFELEETLAALNEAKSIDWPEKSEEVVTAFEGVISRIVKEKL